MMSKNRQKWWISTNFQEKISLWWKSTKKTCFCSRKRCQKMVVFHHFFGFSKNRIFRRFSTVFKDFWSWSSSAFLAKILVTKWSKSGGFPPNFRIFEKSINMVGFHQKNWFFKKSVILVETHHIWSIFRKSAEFGGIPPKNPIFQKSKKMVENHHIWPFSCML